MSDEKEAKTKGPWEKIKDFQPVSLRPPTSASDVNVTPSQVDDDNVVTGIAEKLDNLNVNDGIVNNSKLNVNAAEFIPIWQKNKETIEKLLMYELNCLTLDPANYEEISEALCEVLKDYTGDNNIMELVINTILDQCIKEPNLRYNGVRLCSHLYSLGGPTFRSILLTWYAILPDIWFDWLIFRMNFSCQREYSNFISNPSSNDSAYLNRICGYALTLAELFLQIQISGNSIVAFGEGLLNILEIILRRRDNESENSVKSVCQVLKLTGRKLENISESSSSQLDDLFSRLKELRDYPDLDPNHRLKINSVLKMRASNWGQNGAETTPSREAAPAVAVNSFASEREALSTPSGEAAPAVAVNSFASERKVLSTPSEGAPAAANSFDDPVFFGPDGKVITEEETSFLHDNIPLSEDIEDYVCEQDDGLMDEEVSNDFEEFLRMSEVSFEQGLMSDN